MRVLIASSAFKGTYSPKEACLSISEGWAHVRPEDDIELCPICDGGDGTIEVTHIGVGGRVEMWETVDAMGSPVNSPVLLMPDGNVLVEVSSSCGLAATKGSLTALSASTEGVGRLVKRALKLNPKKVFVAMGGSASTDGGMGCAKQLGVTFYDPSGSLLDTGNCIEDMCQASAFQPASLPGQIVGIYDVAETIHGACGAARMFSPQKGASADEVDVLASSLKRLTGLAPSDLECEVGTVAGGGLGWGILALLDGRLVAGFDWISRILGLQSLVNRSDIVIVGEGSIDAQTLLGKAPERMAALAKTAGKCCFAVAGSQTLGTQGLRELGIRDIETANGAQADPGVLASSLARRVGGRRDLVG